MFEKWKVGNHLFLFKDSYTSGKHRISTRKLNIETFNSKIKCDYCVLQCTDSGEVTIGNPAVRKNVFPKISFIITKVVSFTPGRLDTPFLSKPVFVPPQLIVQDQGGTQFNLFETHRINYSENGFNFSALDSKSGTDATIITLCDRVYKLMQANRLATPYLNKTLIENKCDAFFMTKENAAKRLQDWKQNKPLYIEMEEKLYMKRQAYQDNLRQQQSEKQSMISDLDNLFK